MHTRRIPLLLVTAAAAAPAIPQPVLDFCAKTGLDPACVKWEVVGHRTEVTQSVTHIGGEVHVGEVGKSGPMYRVYVPLATVW